MARKPEHYISSRAPRTLRADMPPVSRGPENWRRDTSPLHESFVECGVIHFGFTAIPVPDAATAGLPTYSNGTLFAYGLTSVRVDQDTGQELKIHGIRVARRGFSDGTGIANAIPTPGASPATYTLGGNAAIVFGINLASTFGIRDQAWSAVRLDPGASPTPRLPYQASVAGALAGQWNPKALTRHAYFEFPQATLEGVGQIVDNERESPLAWTAPIGSTIDAALIVNGNVLNGRTAILNTLYGWCHGQIRCSMTRNANLLSV
jgi:hypothetical protein